MKTHKPGGLRVKKHLKGLICFLHGSVFPRHGSCKLYCVLYDLSVTCFTKAAGLVSALGRRKKHGWRVVGTLPPRHSWPQTSFNRYFLLPPFFEIAQLSSTVIKYDWHEACKATNWKLIIIRTFLHRSFETICWRFLRAFFRYYHQTWHFNTYWW